MLLRTYEESQKFRAFMNLLIKCSRLASAAPTARVVAGALEYCHRRNWDLASTTQHGTIETQPPKAAN